ncbi:tetratricopeptide repeat protein [Rhizomicrobium electricum]|uniref:Tetratricopeptide repeat protein n=1 Tax=Rhizomicrobium electricum TaxID=480070 RepID=A0ABN1F5G5_9PROT|nr:tetratricopeptide repeat protein [Rhizomicrobium electricum]NIJ49439.1 Flp pilus assembly protein TadD [Rhizomicrobium electricum]
MSRLCHSLGAVAVSALLCTSALASPPEQPTGTLAQGVDSGIREAQIKRTQKDYAGAVKVLSQLMLVAPDDPRVVGEYGKVLIQQGRAGEALDFLRRAVQLKSDDWTLYSALGVAYDQKADYASAEAAYSRALQLKPGEAAVLNNFAMSRLQAGDLDRARQLIAQAANGSKDERVVKNATMIANLKAAPAKTAVPANGLAASAPPKSLARTLTAAEGNTIVMQAVPKDPQAGPVGKQKVKKTAAARPAKTKDAIPALRLSGGGQ